MTDTNDMRELDETQKAMLSDIKPIFGVDDPAVLGAEALSVLERVYRAGMEHQHSHRARGQPVAYRVTGNYTDTAMTHKSSAESYCRGLLTTDPEGGYRVSPLYAEPPISAAVPEGYALVPTEPTREMLLAQIVEPLRDMVPGHEAEEEVLSYERENYRSMLAAAPKPEPKQIPERESLRWLVDQCDDGELFDGIDSSGIGHQTNMLQHAIEALRELLENSETKED